MVGGEMGDCMGGMGSQGWCEMVGWVGGSRWVGLGGVDVVWLEFTLYLSASTIYQ